MRVGGQTYRVVATVDDHHVQRLAELVDRKHAEVVPKGQGRGVTPQQGMFLTALALAEEVEEQRTRAARLELERDRSLRLATRAREVVARLLARVDSALSSVTGASASAPPDRDRDRDPPSLSLQEARPSTPLDVLTEPPDAIHEPLLIEMLPPSVREQDTEAGAPVPRAPRGPLRLVRHSRSSDDDSR